MIELAVTLASGGALTGMYDPQTVELRPEFEAAWREAAAGR